MSHSTIGVDVSKDKLDVVSWCSEEQSSCSNPRRQFSNSTDGHERLAEFADDVGASIVIMEATGGLEEACAAHLRDAGVSVEVVNPRQARQFASSMGYLEKTDGIDAQALAEFAQVVKPSEDYGHDELTYELKQLVRRREQLVEMRSKEKNRRKRQTEEAVIASLDRIIDQFDNEIEEIDEQIEDLVSDSRLESSVQILTSVPGVAMTTATSLLANMPELGELNRKEIAKLGGLAPLSNDSGEYHGKRQCYGGRPRIRTAMRMAALSAVQHCKPIKRFYNRLLGRGKEKSVALIAAARKLLTILNSMMRTESEFEPQKAMPKS